MKLNRTKSLADVAEVAEADGVVDGGRPKARMLHVQKSPPMTNLLTRKKKPTSALMTIMKTTKKRLQCVEVIAGAGVRDRIVMSLVQSPPKNGQNEESLDEIVTHPATPMRLPLSIAMFRHGLILSSC